MIYNYPGFFPFRRTPFCYGSYTRPVSNFESNKLKSASLSSTSTKEPATKTQCKTSDKVNDTDILLEIFGIKLYFDDILLICLIFFLYNEGVKDQYLFVALILLLIS